MAKTDRARRSRRAADAAEAKDVESWSRVLSLTGALLSHMASHPGSRRLITEMLEAGITPPNDWLDSDAPFDEPLTGLHTRELREPDLFQRLFGPRGAASALR